MQQAFSIRLSVFVREQGVPVGTARLVIKNGRAKIGRMAVLKRYRGQGVGKALLKRAIESARKRCAKTIYLHAQNPVVGFYEKTGFRYVGRVFKEAGIPHRKMILGREPLLPDGEI